MPRETPSTDPGSIHEEGLEELEILANEHRIAILRTLADASDPLPFSKLRRAVGIEDTGRFNYHLTELRGRFIRKTDGGYELGYAGERIVLATTSVDPESVAITADRGDTDNCPVCGESNCGKLIHVHLSGK